MEAKRRVSPLIISLLLGGYTVCATATGFYAAWTSHERLEQERAGQAAQEEVETLARESEGEIDSLIAGLAEANEEDRDERTQDVLNFINKRRQERNAR